MKFIVTHELGRLAKWLRILGYDTIYHDKDDKSKLVITSLRDERIILTRDAKMSRFTGVRMLRIARDEVERQLEQVIKELNLININGNDIWIIIIISISADVTNHPNCSSLTSGNSDV